MFDTEYEENWNEMDDNIRYELYYLGENDWDGPSSKRGDNRDFTFADGEPFSYDDSVLDSIPFDDIFSLEAEDIYKELVMHNRLSAEMEKSKGKPARYLVKRINPNEDPNNIDVAGYKDLDDSYLNFLIDYHFDDEKAHWNSFSEEIQMQEDHEMAIEDSIDRYHKRNEEPVFWGDEHECWCDEYAPGFDPFDSLDGQYYDY